MERQSFSGEPTFHWRLNSQLHVEQPSIRSHPQFILHSLEILFLILYVSKRNIRSFSHRKTVYSLGDAEIYSMETTSTVSMVNTSGTLDWSTCTRWVCKAISQKYLQESSQGPHTTETLLLWHRIVPTTFSQSLLPNPELEMQSNSKGGPKKSLHLKGSWEKLE